MKNYLWAVAGVMACLPMPGIAAPVAQVASPKSTATMGFWHYNYWMWRAFSQLSSAERRKFYVLQRRDPQQFQKEFQKRGEALKQEFYRQKKEIKALVDKYQSATDREKIAIKKQLIALEQRDFKRRIDELSHQIELTRKRVAKMEDALDKRRKHADEIVQVRVDAMLNGELVWPYLRPVNPAKKTK